MNIQVRYRILNEHLIQTPLNVANIDCFSDFLNFSSARERVLIVSTFIAYANEANKDSPTDIAFKIFRIIKVKLKFCYMPELTERK